MMEGIFGLGKKFVWRSPDPEGVGDRIKRFLDDIIVNTISVCVTREKQYFFYY